MLANLDGTCAEHRALMTPARRLFSGVRDLNRFRSQAIKCFIQKRLCRSIVGSVGLIANIAGCSDADARSSCEDEKVETHFAYAVDVIGRTKKEAEYNLFEWVRIYGTRAGYNGPILPIPDQVILPNGQLAWKRFDRVNQLKYSDFTVEALGKIEDKLSQYPNAVYSLRESDGAIAVFFF